MQILIWLAVLVGGGFAGFEVATALTSGYSAPQQAAAAGLALSYVIIPYCMARAISEIIVASRQYETPKLKP